MAEYGKKSGHGGGENPLEGCEQISKIASGTGDGPIQTPLDKGHHEKGGQTE